MEQFFIGVGIALLLLIGMVLIRAVIGPTVMDRLVAVNVLGTKATIVLLVLGVIFDRLDMFVDIAIGYGLLNFIASIAAAKNFQKLRQMHPSDAASIPFEGKEEGVS